MKNLNLLFNKTYYKTIGTAEFADKCIQNNNAIISTKFNTESDYLALDACMKDTVKTVFMVTTYPGMLIGTGYAHGTDKSNDDIKIGFSFDYVSGQPYIPGSSVKGLLRSYFKNQPEAVSAIIQSVLNKTVDVKALESKIFDRGDVFLDAVVAKGSAVKNSHGGNLMDLDNITPHGDITKNPVPLLILRIMPGVHIEFRYILKDGILKAEEKLKLFGAMLELFGAGAKTNVGYGQLVPQ